MSFHKFLIFSYKQQRKEFLLSGVLRCETRGFFICDLCKSHVISKKIKKIVVRHVNFASEKRKVWHNYGFITIYWTKKPLT